ncbi:MAG: hypothetical protein B6242_16920 [Anaerolineaceae bacterium 4572_78]|nr:MAG: hypothetical protein B6242_16920 [Anaerolineaceae bacterium 4572_78]
MANYLLEQNLAEWERLKAKFHCYIPDVDDAEKAAHLRITEKAAHLRIILRRKGWQLEAIDAIIAIVAVRYDLILLTKDKDFRKVPLLKKVNWLL